ncbi:MULTISPECIES: helix-turn-helix transcriptional regulator [Pseudomonas]|uniref:helix-turn-helix transcriptional regulator n=1 Tax=Pseudomonas TaxID=286 RepID=UPI0009F90600|nr:AlpA family phage regulatory protein [Pseudomonas syringae]
MQEHDKFLSTKTVCSTLSISRITLWRWQRDGIFPPCRYIGPRRVAWLESEVKAWMVSRPVFSGE